MRRPGDTRAPQAPEREKGIESAIMSDAFAEAAGMVLPNEMKLKLLCFMASLDCALALEVAGK